MQMRYCLLHVLEDKSILCSHPSRYHSICTALIKKIIHQLSHDTATALQHMQLWRFGSTLLIGMMMVKSGWDLQVITLYEVLFFMAHVLSFAWVSGIKNALLSAYPKSDANHRPQIIKSVALLLFLLSFLIAGIFYIGRDHISLWLTGEVDLPYTSWIALYLLINPISVMIELTYLLRNQSAKITRYTMCIYPLQLLLAFLSVVVFDRIDYLIAAMILWALVRFVWVAWVMYYTPRSKVDIKWMRQFLWLALPLILQMLISNGMEYIDGIIVTHYFDLEMFPIFRYGARELPVTSILVLALSSAMVPLAVKNLSDTMSQIKARTLKLMHMLYPLSVILLFMSPLLYTWVYSEKFVSSAFIFNIYLMIVISRILLPQVMMLSHQRHSALMGIAIVELFINVGLSLYWAKGYGLEGVAYATLVANLSHVVMMIIYNRWVLHIHPSSYIPWKTYSLYSVLLLVAFIISKSIYS